ncbi:NUDIX domain-containing protein [candidate division WWE3 bacterium]|uniref:NUDIX domain-containing protein n=1 Tax=candidate division WWE3 bacterium TaxID=2053526 RepID=A0A7X9DK13_UNCKA|nr:NUDIX domain-containing protein [candidate division WWE3 bacterium]
MSNHILSVRIAVLAVIEKDGKYLLQRRFKTGWRDGYFSLVGGNSDGNETLREALVRELKEEIGIQVKTEDLDFIHLLHISPKVAGNEFFYNVFYVKAFTGEPKICEPEKSDKLEWFSWENLPDNLIPTVKKCWEDARSGIYYSEYGWLPNETEKA